MVNRKENGKDKVAGPAQAMEFQFLMPAHCKEICALMIENVIEITKEENNINGVDLGMSFA
jgi:hypothetical protein